MSQADTAASIALSTGAQKALFDELAEAGLRALYNLDYAEARKQFQAISERFPGHPIGPYALTTALWWELTNEYDEKNPELEEEFLKSANRTIDLTQKMLRAGDPTGVIHLSHGGALGLKSRWEAIEGQWLRSYRHGKQAFKAQEEAVRLNPELYDAYLGVGIFHYYTAVLPRVVKILAKLLIGGGNKEQGLREIHLAMEKGQFSRIAAKLFLVGIYSNREKDHKKALALLREGREEFPRSAFFHFLEMVVLENAKEWAALEEQAADYIARVERGEPSYSKKYLHRGYFSQANSHLGRNRLPEALALYEKIIAEFPYEDRWITFTYLNRGKTYDLMGRRDEALENYRTVLKRRDVWESHSLAEKHLDEPYKGKD